MMKYLPSHTKVVFAEVPDEITLAIAITGCQFHCVGCHSKELWLDDGEDLTRQILLDLIDRNPGITCVCFMGEGRRIDSLNARAKWIKHAFPKLKVALYTGRAVIPFDLDLDLFDYVKIGPYNAKLGPLNKPTTNQQLYHIKHGNGIVYEDITYKFWKKKHENTISAN